MSKLFKFAGVTLEPGFYVAEDNLPQQVPRAKLPRTDGARNIRGSLDARTIRIRGRLIGLGGTIGAVDLRAKIDSLRSAIFASAPASLYAGRSDRYLRNAQCEGVREVFDATGYDRNVEVELEFLAADPYYYSTTATSDSWTVTASGQSRNILVSGNAAAAPVFTFTIAGAGPVTLAITLTNNSTGKSFTLTGAAYGGDVIVVDTLNQTVTTSGVNTIALFDGIWTPMVGGGFSNSLTVTYTGPAVTSIATSFIARNY